MIKNVNQSMVNRSISGGGGNCKCINGSGISGSDVSGGKITVEFTVYEVEETTITADYIKKEDAERVFREILSVDLEKYVFYRISEYMDDSDGDSWALFGVCYVSNVVLNNGKHTIGIVASGAQFNATIYLNDDNSINYDNSSINNTKLTEDPINPDTVKITTKNAVTLYYREF